jgi:omega-6 fatty acid desaturase (delta-12 desaturase)
MEVVDSMSSIARIKQQKRSIINQYARADNWKGFTQVVTTFVPLCALWWVAVQSADVSYWLSAAVILLMSLFLVRVFVLMHDCGHGSLFRTAALNKSFGFAFGVVAGIPQYVWSRHHAYHHATNGNWAKYRGPLAIVTVDEYEALTHKQRRNYERARSTWLAPIAGFLYLIFNPRVTFLKGSFSLVAHIIRKKIAQPGVSIKAHAADFATPYWASAKEYWHMFWSNLALLAVWVLMSWAVGPALFLTVYLISVSLAGGAGIALFTVQHNFEHAYASGDEGWDRDTAAIRGSSFLILPNWLNWFTANIAHHHIHHLSARIPNYCLLKCHQQYEHLFTDVTRVSLSQVPKALKCILWDTRLARIISIAEYQQQNRQASFG